jgi:membrane fusion protein, multidrug efflux system
MNKWNNLSVDYLRRYFWFLFLIIILLFGLMKCHGSTPSKSKTKPPQAVVLATARTVDVPVYLTALGSIIPTYTVTVKTQVSGRLLRVLYKEGQQVKAGDLLAQVDPRPYQAQLLQYQGQFARDNALLSNAKVDLERYKKLYKEDSIAKQVLDTQAWLVKQYEGTVKLDQGQIDGAEVNLTYCHIISPISGRVGLRLVDEGNLVQTSDPNGLVVINTLTPINALFSIPEDSVPQVIEQMNRGKTLWAYAYDRNQDKLLATGRLLTLDNQIDPSTGTLKLKAQFPNQDNKLFPNQFVNIKLLINTLAHSIVIPTAAIQNGTKGAFVFVFNKKNTTVHIQNIIVGVAFGENTQISSGLSPGEQVVTEGVDKLTDGVTVTVANRGLSLQKGHSQE